MQPEKHQVLLDFRGTVTCLTHFFLIRSLIFVYFIISFFFLFIYFWLYSLNILLASCTLYIQFSGWPCKCLTMPKGLYERFCLFPSLGNNAATLQAPQY